jgi:hypothetical protein
MSSCPAAYVKSFMTILAEKSDKGNRLCLEWGGGTINIVISNPSLVIPNAVRNLVTSLGAGSVRNLKCLQVEDIMFNYLQTGTIE